jgi:quinol monooxygenase YgiN
MTQQKLTHTEIVRISYQLAARLLEASASSWNIQAFDEHLNEEDVKRVAKQIKKIAARLSRQAH